MEGIYVDVRELDEFKAGHLKGAIHCPLSELKKGNIPTDLPNLESIDRNLTVMDSDLL